MDNVQDESLNLDEEKIIATVIKRCVAFQLPLKVTLVVLKLALLYGINAITPKVEHLGKATNL